MDDKLKKILELITVEDLESGSPVFTWAHDLTRAAFVKNPDREDHDPSRQQAELKRYLRKYGLNPS